MRTVLLLLLLALLAGCRVGAPLPDPVPLRGPTPQRVAIWPAVVGETAFAASTLLDGLDRAVRGRGYAVPAVAVGRQLLEENGVPPGEDGGPEDVARAGQALNADAVFVLQVHRFDATVEPWRGASWDLTWQLLSTRGHGVLWERSHSGAWWRQLRDDGDPMPRAGDELRTVTLGAAAGASYADLGDLLRSLHRHVCERLPRAEAP